MKNINPVSQVILVNFAIFVAYMLGQFVNPSNDWILLFLFHIPLMLVFALIFLIAGRKEWAQGSLVSFVLVLMVGLAVCSLPGVSPL